METKTKELPLVSAANAPTSQVPRIPAAADDPTRRIEPEYHPGLQADPAVPPPFGGPPGDVQAAQAVPQSAPPQLPPAAVPLAFQPVGVAGSAPALQATPPTPAARRPRRWPVAIASWLGGVVVGMLLLMLGLGMFGGAREVAANTGDPTAAWDNSITLTDAYLTAQARKSGNAQVQDPTMRIKADGTIAMEGRANLFGRSVPVNGTLQPTIADGKLKMEIVSMQLGGLPLPEFLVTQMQNSVAGSAQPPAAAAATDIVKVEATEGKLVIYSKLK